MQRLIAGAGLLMLALSACGSRGPSGPPPHIVALGVSTTEVTELASVSTPAPAAPAPALPPARASRSSRRNAGPAMPITGDLWGRLARCESGGNPQAVGGRGKFFGAFQFTLATWHSLGLSGSPVDYSYADQLAAAQRLQARSGWRNWPVCARRVQG